VYFHTVVQNLVFVQNASRSKDMKFNPSSNTTLYGVVKLINIHEQVLFINHVVSKYNKKES